eukprot:2429-Heterococcus_DN1.PRE.6
MTATTTAATATTAATTAITRSAICHTQLHTENPNELHHYKCFGSATQQWLQHYTCGTGLQYYSTVAIAAPQCATKQLQQQHCSVVLACSAAQQ